MSLIMYISNRICLYYCLKLSVILSGKLTFTTKRMVFYGPIFVYEMEDVFRNIFINEFGTTASVRTTVT